jgi:hypothetical protein
MEAATWCRQFRKTHPKYFPLDTRELLRPERVKISKPKAQLVKPKIKLK